MAALGATKPGNADALQPTGWPRWKSPKFDKVSSLDYNLRCPNHTITQATAPLSIPVLPCNYPTLVGFVAVTGGVPPCYQ